MIFAICYQQTDKHNLNQERFWSIFLCQKLIHIIAPYLPRFNKYLYPLHLFLQLGFWGYLHTFKIGRFKKSH